MSVERRTLLKSTAAGAAAVGGPFAGLVAMSPDAQAAPPNPGALLPIPDERDGAVRLHVPKGFKYQSFHDTEQPVVLTDGTNLPGRHDGMGAFKGPRHSVILIRNHELNNPPPPPAGAPPRPTRTSARETRTTRRRVAARPRSRSPRRGSPSGRSPASTAR